MHEETMSNPLLSLLDIDYPLIQAPMAGVSTPALAAAVSNAGALGSLGLGASTVAQAEAMIVATRQLTDRPFNVNLFCHAPPRRDARREADWATTLRPHFARYGSTPPDSLSEIYQTFIGHAPMLELLLDLSPAVVSFHFGLPEGETIQRLRRQGIVTLATATSLQEALLIELQGIDVVVAQGYEAGGHRGIFAPQAPDAQLSTFTLVQL
ncbi:TPA: NAD(P)H-dependent flavin oxidoreductase, partial [Klebsiella pneumoniae]